MKFPYQKHVVVCTGGRCNAPQLGPERGEEIRKELKDLNRELGLKQTVRVCTVSCLDLCDDGPNMVIWPDGTVHSHLTRESARSAYLQMVEIVRGEKSNA